MTLDVDPPTLPPAAAPHGPPSAALWLFHLFFRPKRFFAHFPRMATAFTLAYATWIVGIAGVMSRISMEQIKEDFGRSGSAILDAALESWPSYWLFCAAAGALGGMMFYAIGGWWYRVRLELSGADWPDARLARRVYIFASLIADLPLVLVTASQAAFYATPLAAERADPGWWYLGMMLLPFWSVYASYRGVRTLFDVVRWKARIWFLVLPSLVYGMVVVGVMAAAVMVGLGVIDLPPDIDDPVVIDRPGFTLRYPGNWWVNTEDDDYDPDSQFMIEPFQDARARFLLGEGPVDPEDETEHYLKAYQEVFRGDDVSTFTRWGSHVGSGVKYRGTTEGTLYVVRIFTTTTDTRNLTVVEWVESSVAYLLKPGFKLMRDSFRFKD